MNMKQCYLDRHPCFQAGKKIKVKGLMLHSVGCPQPSAGSFVEQWNSPSAARACVHGFIDGNTGEVFQTLPWDYRAWHCGGEANNTHIGVEMCEPSCLRYTGGAAFICSNADAAREVVSRTYHAAVELFAFLCKQYNLNPLQDGIIISHKEGHDRGMASAHGDPEHIWNQLNTGYTMDTFRAEVEHVMKEGISVEEEVQKGTQQPAADMITGPAEIRPGDHVKIMSEAVYYNDKAMPEWVKTDTWIVSSVKNDRVVIDKNENGSKSICSPVNVKYLIKQESEKEEDHRKAPLPALSVNNSFCISAAGIQLIAKYEGCRLEAYKCPAGVWTIGYGHTEGVQSGQRITQQQAVGMLQADAEKYADYVNAYKKNGIISFSLNQNQFDALASFTYNCGPGNLKSLVSGRSAMEVADKFPAYNKGGGKVLEGLTRRRNEERELFLKV